MEIPPPPAAPEPSVLAPPASVWRTGTLTYTTGSLVVLFGWLLWGDFVWALRDRVTPNLFVLLLKKFEASDTLTAICMGSLPPAMIMIVTPIISYLSDRHRGPWGRRVPYLLITLPFFVISLLGLAFGPVLGGITNRLLGSHSFGLNATILIFLMSFWAVYDLSTSVANPIYSGLVNDVVPQLVMGRFYALFRALSLVAGIIFNYWIFGTAEGHSMEIFIVLAIVFGLGFTLMCMNVKEGRYPPPPPRKEGGSISKFLKAAKTFCIDCYGKSYYWWFYAAFSLSWTASVPFQLFAYYYARSLNIDTATFGRYGALTLSISLVLAYPLGILADRFHPLRLGIAVQAIYALDLLLSAIFVVNPWTFGVALVVNGVLFGTWSTAVASVSQRLLPKGKFAQYGAGGLLVGSLFSMTTAPLFGIILDHLHHHYRYTFLLGFGFALAGVFALLVLHAKFMAHGGPEHYLAPE